MVYKCKRSYLSMPQHDSKRRYKAVTTTTTSTEKKIANEVDVVFDTPYVVGSFVSFTDLEEKLYRMEEIWLKTFDKLMRFCVVNHNGATHKDLILFLECNKDRVVYPTDGTLMRTLREYTKHWIVFTAEEDLNCLVLIPTVDNVWKYTCIELLNVCKVLHKHKNHKDFCGKHVVTKLLYQNLKSPSFCHDVIESKLKWEDQWQIRHQSEADLVSKVQRLVQCYLAVLK
jgi:hypothetical protein